MDSQVVAQPHEHHTYEHDPRNAGLHPAVEGEDHPEKKSVLRKVKAKAKKLRDTITKHGHGHDHDHDHQEGQYNTPDDHDLDEEEDDEENEETVEDPQIHGAPIYESAAVMSGASSARPNVAEKDQYSLEGNQGREKVNFGERTLMDDDIRTPANTPQGVTPSAPRTTQHHADPTRTLVHDDQNQSKVNLASPAGLEKDQHGRDSGGHCAPNYQSKVTDPTGSVYESAGVMSGVSSAGTTVIEKDQYSLEGNQARNRVNFGETTLMDDGNQTPANTPQAVTQSSPRTTQNNADPTRTVVHELHGKENEQNRSSVNLASPVGLEKDPHRPDSGGHYVPNYQSKVTDPTGSGGKEIDVAPITSSLGKMNVNEEAGPDENIPTETRGGVSHLPTGSHDQFSPEPNPMENESSRPDVNKMEDHDGEKPPGQGSYAEKISTATAAVAEKAMAAKDLVASKLGYGGQDQAHHNQQEGNLGNTRAEQTGYTEKISSVATAIAEKAASAKDVVSSKLGYGKKDESASPETGTGVETTKPASPNGNKKGIVDTVTEKLTPVYAKVAGTSGILTSKAKAGSSSPEEVKEGVGVQQQDKGISVKDYLGEKLKPGEEDKALSEMISGALNKKKEGGGEKGKVLGKVTESEEVKARSGTEEERHMSEGPREGVVEKLKGTVGSWLGKNEATSHAPESHDDPNVAREDHSGERRLQESTH